VTFVVAKSHLCEMILSVRADETDTPILRCCSLYALPFVSLMCYPFGKTGLVLMKSVQYKKTTSDHY